MRPRGPVRGSLRREGAGVPEGGVVREQLEGWMDMAAGFEGCVGRNNPRRSGGAKGGG